MAKRATVFARKVLDQIDWHIGCAALVIFLIILALFPSLVDRLDYETRE